MALFAYSRGARREESTPEKLIYLLVVLVQGSLISDLLAVTLADVGHIMHVVDELATVKNESKADVWLFLESLPQEVLS